MITVVLWEAAGGFAPNNDVHQKTMRFRSLREGISFVQGISRGQSQTGAVLSLRLGHVGGSSSRLRSEVTLDRRAAQKRAGDPFACHGYISPFGCVVLFNYRVLFN